MRTSYSALDTYKQCPQKYKFQEIDRIPFPKGKEAVFGTIIHGTLRFMFERGPLYPTLDQVQEHFRTRLAERKSLWVNNEEYALWHEEGTRMLKNFYAKNAPWNFSVIDLESKFEVLLLDEQNGETHILVGKIDRIDKLPDGNYEIIDYKTSRKLPSQEKVDKDLQLSIYSLGLQKKWPHLQPEHIGLSLYFLKHGEKLSTVRTVEATEATKREVLGTISEISKKTSTGERFEPAPSPLCDWCPYKPMCPAWKHLYHTNDQRPTTNDIQPILKDYFIYARQKDAAEEKIAELKKKIREYMEQEGYDRVFGEDGYVSRSLQKRFAHNFEKVRAILEPLGKWEEILTADEKKLKAMLKTLPPHVRQDIESLKVLTKEFTVLTTSAKKTEKTKKPKETSSGTETLA